MSAMNRPLALVAPLVAAGLVLTACTGGATPAPALPTPPATSSPSTESPESATAPTDDGRAWPPSVSEAEFFSGTPAAAAWLITGPEDDIGSWDAVEADAAAVGYDVAALPIWCHDLSFDLVDSTGKWGVPVFFATEADATRFAALWAGDDPVVVGIGHIGCDFD
jgi:hypothetical protein